jgi:hypothetical protein
MADYGVNIAIKFSETKLNKLTDKLNKASKSANKINEAFKKVQQKGGASLDKTNGTLDKKLTRLKNINKELQRENKLLTENASLQRQATRSGRGGAGRSGGGLGGGGRLSQAVLGGGFPLLFGGGPLQALGGFAGGAIGGFAGGIAGQLLVGQFEQLGKAAAELGQAFSATSFDLDRVAEATGIVGTETEEFLGKIEKYGSAAKAAELATKLLATKVGQDGVNALTKFGNDAVTLGNNLSVIFTQVLSEIAKVAGPLLEALAKFAGEQADIAAFKKRTGLGGREKLAQDILNIGLGKTGTGGLGVETAMAGGLKLRAKQLGLTDLSDAGLRQFATQTAVGSQRKFEMPVLQEIKGVAAGIQAPTEIRDANRAEKDRMKALQDRINIAAKQRDIELKKEASFNKQLDSIGDQNELLRARLEGNVEEVQMQQQINKLVEEYGDDKRDAVELVVKEKFALQEQVKVAEQMKRVYAEIGSTIKSGVVDAISSAVEGTKTLGEVASNVLRNIANRLLDLGVAFGLNALFPGSSLFPNPLTGRASGGGVGAGRPYLVGERGPELFVPGAQGNIVPNNAMGSTSVVVNVDASGTEVQGNQGNADQLGRLIGAAVQAELIKQKRPGGLLTR